jgi:hypothetical protein
MQRRRFQKTVCSLIFVVSLFLTVTSCRLNQFEKQPFAAILDAKKLAESGTGTYTAPVVFRAVVTYSAPDLVFLQDKTGGIAVDAAGAATLPPIGSLV